MNRKEYYEMGKKSSIPLRCPILNYCARRASTIYINSEYNKYSHGKDIEETLIKNGTLPADYIKNKIDVQGEPPEKIGGENSFYVSHMCPEVNLFDNSNSLFPGNACVEGDYDKERIYNKKQILKTQHYSECAEFNKYLFEIKVRVQSRKKRIAVPPKLKAELQKEINSKCPLCYSEEVGHFEIHHIDENPENNNFANLLMICPTCHSKITKGDINLEKVQEIKLNLS